MLHEPGGAIFPATNMKGEQPETDFEALRRMCMENATLSKTLIDDFLLYYAARRNGIDRTFVTRLNRYADVVAGMPEEWLGRAAAQFMAHRIFRRGGLMEKYIHDPGIKALGEKEHNYLTRCVNHPWRFSFSKVVGSPAEDFYQMQDVFRGDSFLLFSPGTTATIANRKVALWLNLVGFNGACWESYGPIGGFADFEPDDIFFYATELNPEIDSDDGLVEDIERNAVPYMILLAGSNYPMVFNKEDQIIHCMAYVDVGTLDTALLKDRFVMAYSNGVCRLALKQWSDYPHFAVAYYDDLERLLVLTAMTDRGFEFLSSALNQQGYAVPEYPEIRVQTSTVHFTSKVVGREIAVNPYERYFSTPADPAVDEQLKKINTLLGLALPDINEGREPDVAALAREAGVEEEVARDLLKQAMKRIRELRKNMP